MITYKPFDMSSVLMTNVYTECCDLPSNLRVVFNKSRKVGSKVLNTNWGGNGGGNYGYCDRVFDDYIFKKDDFVVVVSA